MTRNRDIAKILGRTEANNAENKRMLLEGEGLDSAQVTTIATDAGLAVYSALDSLPISNLTSGDQAYVEENNRLYISNGTGWYNVSLVNLSPTFDSDINSTFTIVDSQTPLIITNPASDSDNPDAIITYSGTMSDSGQYLVALTQDSSVWTFTPLSADSVYDNVTLGNIPDSDGGDFTYTFTASDGINQATKQITITYDDLKPEPVVDTVTRSAASVNEGSTFSFTVTTIDTPDNYRVYWRVQGTSSTNDISSPSLSGNNRIEEGYITVTNNSATSATFTAAADATTEGSETFIFDVTRLADESGNTIVSYTNTKRDTVTINDTSVAPSNTYISATGGTVTTVGDYKYHAFTSTGNTNFVVSSVGSGDGEAIEYLIVAGGGGGGWESTNGAGGGGAGGVIHHAGWTGLSAQTYVMSVGAGGAARTKGSNSTAFGNTAIGGGPGASAFSSGGRTQNLDGGSGGGGGVDSGVARRGAAEAQTTISGATAYGNIGSYNETGSPYYPGAGGGAGGAAVDATTSVSGDGGAGRLFSNFTSFGVSGYFAGGGGGGISAQYGGTDAGAGGSGGGGTGGNASGGSNGTANTGGGAGGGQNSGGSGIIIVRYKFQ